MKNRRAFVAPLLLVGSSLTWVHAAVFNAAVLTIAALGRVVVGGQQPMMIGDKTLARIA